MSLLEECIDYFRNPAFNRFIDAWISKYQSLGYLGGTIKLEQLTLDEQESLGALLGMDLSNGKLHLTYHQFQKQYLKTKFEEIDFLLVLKKLSPVTLYTKKELQVMKQEQQKRFQDKILAGFKHTPAYNWLNHYFNENNLVVKYIQTNQEDYALILTNVAKALNKLPCFFQSYQLISIFAQEVTKDPHYFDKDLAKELLLKGIENICKIDDNERTIEDINEILYCGGLLKDDLSNNCYICHLLPLQEHSSWQGFYDNYEPWNMNLYNLSQLTTLFNASSVYIVENPSVFRTLVIWIKQKKLDIGLICSNGQINLCTYMLIDKLIESNCLIYYAGDYDPEGLLIADKLKKRYQDKLQLWCYDVSYLEQIGINQEISQKRIQILQHINNEKLKMIAQKILVSQKVGYQEGLINIYQENIK